MDGWDDWDPYPIVLERPGARWSIAVALATTVLAISVAATTVCSTTCRQNAVYVAVLGAVATIGFAWDRMKDATKRRLVIDRRGFVIDGRPVPWEAVMSMQWVPAGGEHGEYIEIFVRNAGGYRAPRSGQVFVDHRSFGMRPNTIIDLFEAAALPRRIPVLAIEPPPARGR